MEKVVVSKTFDGSIPEMVALCRTLDSRDKWPGSVTMGARPDVLEYQLGMRLKKVGSMTDLDIEEHLGPVEESGNTTTFSIRQRLTWPYGHEDAEGEYRFTAGQPNTVQFTYLYNPPSTKLIKTKELPGFHQGLETVIGIYLERLAQTVSVHS